MIQVGDDPASSVYVNNKKKACAYIGIRSVAYELAEETTEDELLSLIDKLNRDASVNGILVQLPLPSHIREEQIIRAIDPKKDVDGFHPENVGRLVTGEGLCFLYAGRHYSVAEAFRHRDPRQELCGCRQKQYCWQADGTFDASGGCDCYRGTF